MFGLFKKNEAKSFKKIEIAVCSLLIHAAKLDGEYKDIEKNTIKECLKELGLKDQEYIDALIIKSEELEKDSIQILEMTKEIKKLNYDNRLEIIEMLLKTIYSDEKTHHFENNLVRRVAGLVYVEDVHVGELKNKLK
tara:strand:- start:521 stop:931 length:411 start_codon:yes stop_codon:yes gene_type:complete